MSGVAVLLAAACCPAAASAAVPTAASEVASYETVGCPSTAPVWLVHYDLYWTGPDGTSLDQSSTQQSVLDEAAAFTHDVGVLSDCAVRAHVDVFSHTDAYPMPLPGTGGGGFLDPPSGYDDEMARVPTASTALGYVGITRGGWGIGSNIYPVNPGNDAGDPYQMLMVHEWLHSVVAFYSSPIGWPFEGTADPDVHGACLPSEATAYPNGAAYGGVPSPPGCGENSLYFHDLMTGNVNDGGQLKGLPPDQWAYQGTPRNPLHPPALPTRPVTPPTPPVTPTRTDPRLSVRVQLRSATAVFRSAGSYEGSLAVTLTNRSGRLVRVAALNSSAGGWVWKIPTPLAAGTWKICGTDLDVTGRWTRTRACTTVTIPAARIAATRLLSLSTNRGSITLRARDVLAGRRATVRFVFVRAGHRPQTRIRTMTLPRAGKAKSVLIPTAPAPHAIRRVTVSIAAFSIGLERYASTVVARTLAL